MSALACQLKDYRHIFELIFQFDFLGNSNTVLGCAGCAE